MPTVKVCLLHNAGELRQFVEEQYAVVRQGHLARLEGGDLEAMASPDGHARALLTRAAEAGGLTARGWTRTLRLARTIADLEGSAGVHRVHVAEALMYRRAALEGPVGTPAHAGP